jgi:YbbR domain-containing protein
MPFQDVEEVTENAYPSSPGVVQGWLRKIFIEDWALKLLALAITLLLWLAVTGVNKPVTIRTGVQLNFIRPDRLDISNEPPRTVDVLLTGRRSNLDKISKLDLVATVDVSDQREGERVVRLTSDRVQMDLPDGVKIESFQPSTIPVRLEPIVERQVEVEVKLVGKLDETRETYSVRASPEQITVRGPAGHVNSLGEAPTESISLDGRRDSFVAPHVAIDIADNKIDLLTTSVDVTVEIGERRTEKTFTGVPVTSEQGGTPEPRVATVTLYCPISVIGQLHPSDIRITLTRTPQNAVEPHLQLPEAIRDRVTLRSIKPSQFTLPR